MKKIILLTIGIFLTSSLTTTAFALDSISGAGNNFSQAWERYASGDHGRANLTYGYNTFLINEDYAWASHTTKKHYAQVSNANGVHFGNDVSGGVLSRVDVVHSGNLVGYANFFR